MSERRPSRSILNRAVRLVLGLCWLGACRVSGRGAGVVILYYHDVPREARTGFARQLDHLRRATTIVDPAELGPLSERHNVAVTFDDGLRSFVDNAVPELVARDIPCLVFVPSGYLGEPPAWVTDGRYDLDEERVMSPDQLRAMPDLVQVGSHTVSHANLTRLPRTELRRELAESRSVLERIVGKAVTTISFPFGAYTEDVVEACRRAGYERVYTTVPRRSGDPAAFLVDRVAVEPTDWRWEFRVKALGGYEWMVHYGRLKRRMLRRLAAPAGDPVS